MGAKTTMLRSLRSKSGDTQSKAGKLTGDKQETVVGLEAQIDALADQGKGLYEISQLLGLPERAVLAHTLGSPDACKTYSRSPPKTTEETKEPLQPTKTLPKSQPTPTFFYCCEEETTKLRMVNLLSGKQSCHRGPSYPFRAYCRWSELPGGSLLITGGGPLKDVEKIDTLREYAVSSQPPMHTARSNHVAVYHSQYLYALGGYKRRWLSECERYVYEESRWEVLPALPIGGCALSAVELENSLYALGGYAGICELDTVQKLSLDSLTWELMQLRLPKT
jgi:hypothetical protein